MPVKKTNSSTKDKVKTTSTKAAKPAPKKVAKPVKTTVVKKAPTSAPKTRKLATKVSTTPKASTASAPVEQIDQTPAIPLEEIQLRAYFISERRQTMGWPGDSSTDWIEAEAQLVAEAKRRLKKNI